MQDETITAAAIERSLQMTNSALNEGLARLVEGMNSISAVIPAVEKIERRSTRLHLVGHAFTGLAVGFVFLAADRFILGQPSLGFGLLGPAAAAAVGAVAFLRSTP